MLKENLTKALSEQINFEMYSSYLYLAMSSYFDRKGLKGFANWFYIQAQEELLHGINIYKYVLERGESIVFGDIKSPNLDLKSVTNAFKLVSEHEAFVTERINNLATLSMKENDHASYVFLQWYINEQVEEEATVDTIYQKLLLIDDNASLLYAIDAEMSTRIFVDPFIAK